MSTKKILIWSSVALVIGAGVFFVIKAKNKKDADEQAKKDAEEIKEAQSASTFSNPKPKVTAKPKPTAPPTPKALPPAMLPKIGTKLYANGDMNTYKTAQAGVSNIYKFYHKGDYIGTFLAGAGSPVGYYWKVLTEYDSTVGTAFKEIYVIASQVKI